MSEMITEAVRSKYGSVAVSGLSTDQTGVRAVAEAFGYSPEELSSIPAEANMGLSCGNPTATAGVEAGRDGRGSGQRRRAGRVPGGSEGRCDRGDQSAST